MSSAKSTSPAVSPPDKPLLLGVLTAVMSPVPVPSAPAGPAGPTAQPPLRVLLDLADPTQAGPAANPSLRTASLHDGEKRLRCPRW